MAKRNLGFRETSTRSVLATVLALALALGTLPTNAVKAVADELAGLDEEVELVEPELEDADDTDGELVVTIGEDVSGDADQDGDDAAYNEATLQAEDVAEPQVLETEPQVLEVEPQVLEAELEGIRAKLTVAADVELPDGAALVITKIEPVQEVDPAAKGEEDALVEQDAPEEGEVAAEGEAVAEGDEVQSDVSEAVKEPTTVKGTEVVLAAMNEAIAADRAENVPDDKDAYEVANAYVVEVVDGEGNVVQLSKDQAALEITLPQDNELLQADGLYAVERVEVEDPEASDEAEAAPMPAVSAFAEDEYETDEDAADATRYAAKATDAAESVAQEEGADEATVALEGVASIAAVKKVEPQAEPAAEPKLAAPRLAAPGGPLKAPAYNAPGTIDTLDTRSLGITINLFNYEAVDTNANTYGTPKTTGINKDKTKDNNLMFFAYGTAGDDNTKNNMNQFTGYAGNNDYTNQYANQGIVKSELSGSGTDYANRYPVLNAGSGESLQYLFDSTSWTNPGESTPAKTVYNDVNNLFYVENNYDLDGTTYREMMVYDSNQHYAVYDITGNANRDFRVYERTFDRSGGGSDGMKVGFFPFNEPLASWWSGAEKPQINAANTGGSKPPVDHHLGLTLNTPFTMPLDGQIRYDGGAHKEDAVFSFSGDDDMWVFVDGRLALDIGGIHQPVSGTINFHTGEIKLGSGTVIKKQQSNYYYVAAGIADTSVVLTDQAWLWNVYGSESNPSFDPSAGSLIHTGIFGDRDTSWRAGTDHTLQAFYMERGGADSNLKISTNLHVLTKKMVEVEKAWANMTPAELANRSIDVELVRKAVNPNDPDDVVYKVIETATLNAGNSWKTSWDELPLGGYIESVESTTPYYDYSYFVREKEVPNGFDVLYKSNGSIISSTDLEYLDHPDGTREFIGTGIEHSPVTMENTHTYMDVEKKWLDKDGNLDQADHSEDEIWVQLYKQVKDSSGKWMPESGEAEGAPIRLNASTNWEGRFDIGEKIENVRYLVKEGTYDTSSQVFTPNDVVYAKVSPYELDRVDYTRTVSTLEGVSSSLVVKDGSDRVSTRGYYWISRNLTSYTEGAVPIWAISRVFDGETTAKQTGGSTPQEFVDDAVSVSLTIPEGASHLGEASTLTDADNYVATIKFDDKLVIQGMPTIDGLDGASITGSNGTYTVTVPAATAKANAGKTFSVEASLTRNGGGNLAEIVSSDPARVTVQQTVYEVTTIPDKVTVTADTTTYHDGVVMTPFGTAHATIYNKPKLTDISLLKLDADAPAGNGYEAGKTPLKGATFIMFKDDGELEGQGTAAHPVYDKTKDTERLPKTSQLNPNQTYTTGDEGKVYLAGSIVKVDDGTGNKVDTPVGLEPGTYWIIETSAPAGYLVRDENYPIGITIATDGTPTLVLDSSYDTATSKTRPTLTGPDANGAYTLTVPDARLYVLPAAGGPGALPFLIAGAFAAALAASSVYDDRKRTAR